MKISNILLTTTLITLGGVAHATETNKYYLSVTGEYVASAKADGNISAAGLSAPMTFDFKDGWGGMLAIGYYLTPELRGELEGGYRELKGDTETVTVGGTSYTASASNTKSKAFTGMGNLYYDIPTGTSITPYIGAGIGMLHKTTNGDSDAFAYQGMAGINYKLDEANTIYAGYRYLGSQDLKDSYTVSGINITDKVNIKAHSVDVGYRFSF